MLQAHRLFENHQSSACDLQQITRTTTNGPEGTVSAKTLESIQMIQEGLLEIDQTLQLINQETSALKMNTLMTLSVENMHAISHFKNETFSARQYAIDFATITKESMKRRTCWGVHYFTHKNSYYPIQKSNMRLEDIPLIRSLPTNVTNNKDYYPQKKHMLEWVKDLRPVRQRTVRGENTKDKCGMLPPKKRQQGKIHN